MGLVLASGIERVVRWGVVLELRGVGSGVVWGGGLGRECRGNWMNGVEGMKDGRWGLG